MIAQISAVIFLVLAFVAYFTTGTIDAIFTAIIAVFFILESKK